MRKLTVWLTCVLLIASMGIANAQTKVITGTVTSAADGTTIPGAQVIVKGTTTGITTDMDGKYSLAVPTSATVLQFTFIGLKTVEVQIGNQTVINVAMEEDQTLLDEVIVVAYGTTTKEAFTGSASVVTAKDLETRTVTSPIAAIEGSTTGVQILSASGQPGSSPGIIIRGVGTLNGSTSPLYVVDGIQFEGSLASINSEDIKSMTVLKDAASTALYGSRAANGVVIITTKTGNKDGKLRVNASTYAGIVSEAIPFYDKATPGEYYELMWEGYKNSLVDGGMTDAEARTEASASIFNRLAYNPFNVANNAIVGTDGVLNPAANVIAKGLDWYEALTQSASRENYSMNIAAGDEKYDVYFSSSYLKEKGYVIASKYDRLTSRLNANFTPTDKIKIGGSINMTQSSQEGSFSRGGSIANAFGFAKNMGSIYPVYQVNPTTGEYILDAAGEKQYDTGEGYPDLGILGRPTNVGRHALAEALWNNDIRKTNDIGSRWYAEYTIIDGLKATVRYGIDVQDYMRKRYENGEVGDGAPGGRYQEQRNRRTVKNFMQILTYNKSLEGGHNFDVTLGHESFDRHFTGMSGMKNTQTVVGISEYDNFSTVSSLNGSSSDKKTEGYFARINYNFNNKYYFSASARRDGSSVFSSNVRWGNFFSVGASWRMDQEDFIKDLDFFDKLKIRASFGQVGNDNLGDFYISQPRYSIFPNAGDPGIFWSDLGNDGLTWETVESYDVALEFAFFDRKIEGSLEYFKKNSTDLLYNVPLPLSIGLNAGPANIANTFNEGIEFGITAHLVKTEDLTWDLTVFATKMRSRITDIPDPFVTGSNRWAVGHSRWEYFIYHSAGVDPDNGDALFLMFEENEDGDYVQMFNDDGTPQITNDYTETEKGYTGESPEADVMGSISNSLSYKGFQLDFMFTYALGGKMIDYGYANMMHEGEFGESLHPDALNGWRNPGDVTDIPRMEYGNPNLLRTNSTRFLTSKSYIALRNLSLSYTFSQKVVRDLGISNLKVFVIGENLFMKSGRSGLDPQYNLTGTPSGNDYNPSRVISAGVNISL